MPKQVYDLELEALAGRAQDSDTGLKEEDVAELLQKLFIFAGAHGGVLDLAPEAKREFEDLLTKAREVAKTITPPIFPSIPSE